VLDADDVDTALVNVAIFVVTVSIFVASDKNRVY